MNQIKCKKKENNLLKIKLMFIQMIGLFLLFNAIRRIIDKIILFEQEDMAAGDFLWRWQECAYVLKGINPFDVITKQVAVDAVIGSLHETAGTVPWAYSLGNIFHFGFLPYEIAQICWNFIFILLLISVYIFTYKKVVIVTENKWCGVISIMAMITNPYVILSYQAGNDGAICCFLIYFMIFLVKDNPYLAGVLLGIASIKPQLAFPFYIALLLKKEWKSFWMASIIPTVSWAITSIFTKTNPISLLLNMGTQGFDTYGDNNNWGIMSIFYENGLLARETTVVLSAIVSIIIMFALVAYYQTLPEKRKNDVVYYSIPAVISTIWFYKQLHDMTIIVVIYIAFIMYSPMLYNNFKGTVTKWSTLILIVVAMFSHEWGWWDYYKVSTVLHIPYISKITAQLLMCIVWIIMCIVMIYCLKKAKEVEV